MCEENRSADNLQIDRIIWNNEDEMLNFYVFWFCSFYQIFVLAVEEILLFDCSSPASLNPLKKTQSPAEYMTAQLVVQNLGMDVNFTVGDGVLYGGFYNAPLENGDTYFIVLRVVSQWKTVSC